ncbi:hypothetical protein [Robiginitomaculum antarcticum]|uniref:hypothetical protein n=1 Tax=Robiginitomaculum antarcticum TaxID=437507 RepID=UPI00035C9DD5|nr:hypothetical protein [Robiginitomaculum antarcticum]
MKPDLKSEIFSNWGEDQSSKFRKDIITVRHKIAQTGLFTDDALAELLDKHPNHKIDVCTMSDHDPQFPNKFLTGDFRDCDGKTLIKAAKAGAVWINVREAMNIHREYKAVLDKMYGAIAQIIGEPMFNARGGILISSPVAKVPYHCDQTETILWHIRGKKRIYIYPTSEEFMSDEAYQNIITQDREDDIPYAADMDDAARAFDLGEGEMISWRLNAPHRVDNQSFCVSITTEYSTRESAFKNSVMFTNAVLRQKFGVKSRWISASGPEKYVKSIAGRILRKVGAYEVPDGEDVVTFKVDPQANSYVAKVDPFVRNF